MPNFIIEFESKARAEFQELPRDIALTMVSVLSDLSNDPRPPGAKRLPGAEGYRVRKGELRILYTVDDEKKAIRVYRAGRRRDVYSKVREKLFQIRKSAEPKGS